MVVIDATILLLMLQPGTPVPAGSDGTQIDKPKERIDFLVKELEKQKTKIIIPTPALAEALVQAGATGTQQIIEHLQKYAVFRIEAFDTRAAVEIAAMTRRAVASAKGKRGDSSAVWAKVKYDRQIVAIAKVCGANTIYSDDDDIRSLAQGARIEVLGLADLPLPPADAQLTLQLNTPAGDDPLIPPTETTDDQARA